MAKDISQLVPDAKAFDAEVVVGLQRATAHTVTTAVQKARSQHRWQDRTYATRNSIEGSVRDTAKGAAGEVHTGENAVRLNDGTRPHEIWPKMGAGVEGPLREGQSRRRRGRGRKFLKFEAGGGTVFARMVNHPGTKPDPFLESAQDYAGEEIDRAVGEMLDGLL